MNIKNAKLMREKSNEVNKKELENFMNKVENKIEELLNYLYDNNGSYYCKICFSTESYILDGNREKLTKMKKEMENLGYEVLLYTEDEYVKGEYIKEGVILVVKICW